MEVDRLHRQLRPLNKRQQAWAVKHCTRLEWTRKYKGKTMSIEHFIVATTKGDWQVLRHFYLYATYRKGGLIGTEFLPVMEQWYNHGLYVFYSRPRFGMGYCNDAWCREQPMSIKRGSMGGAVLSDPRELGYCDVLYEEVSGQFRYLTDIGQCNIGKVYRAVNIDPIYETMLKQNRDEYVWCARAGMATDKRKTAAVRIARRHHYNYRTPEWCDLLDNLIYLGKDIRNPHYICPDDLTAMHDEIASEARAKREGLSRRQYEALEEARRRRIQQAELERIEADKKAREAYPKARARFFGVLIQGQGLQIKCLQSVEEFKAEGEAMHHCVFGNAYYDMQRHPNSLILSAKTEAGERAETIEVDLRDYHIVQSRGKCNMDTEYHDTIIQLLTDNMDVIRKADKRRRRAV